MMPDIASVIASLEKKYGAIITPLKGGATSFDVDAIPTRLVSFDVATGIGGIPLGFFTEVYSPEGVGKTTFALHVVAMAQKIGIEAAYIDVEHRLDPVWAEKIGVDLSRMYVTQPPYGEAALTIAKKLIEAGIRLIVIDSVPALVPQKELDGETGDQFVGLQARMLAQMFRQITPVLRANSAAIVLNNQLRSKIGGGGSLAYGPQQTTAGGWSVRYYSSIRIDMRRVETLKDPNGEPFGHRIVATIKKNSLGVPFRSADIILVYGNGFDQAENILDQAINLGFISRAGSWYTLGEDKVQGRSSIIQLLKETPGLIDELYTKISGILVPGSNSDE